jgi:hypothetical protein
MHSHDYAFMVITSYNSFSVSMQWRHSSTQSTPRHVTMRNELHSGHFTPASSQWIGASPHLRYLYLFVAYFTMLSGCWMVGSLVNTELEKACKEEVMTCQGSIPASAWKDWQKPWNESVNMAGVLAKIQTDETYFHTRPYTGSLKKNAGIIKTYHWKIVKHIEMIQLLKCGERT